MKTQVQCLVLWFLDLVVYVSCYPNLALNKPAWMSTVISRSVSTSVDNAVDGNLGTFWGDGVCTGTEHNDLSPWFVVDLLGQYEVHNITIYNRNTYGERLHDFVIQVYKENPSRCSKAVANICKTYPGMFGSIETVECEAAVSGRFVRIWKPTTLQYDDILTVCEVEVYGIRPEQFTQLCSSASYKITPGKRLNAAGMALVSAESKIACVQRCFVTDSCVGVNYKDVSWECEIITRPEPGDILSSDPHWLYLGDDLC
ncbi:fucolectin-like [Haliotis cracherodii]|uniref:fucolectin-like n=1 Tax=Haliotis cracherodii TaxID=6455 RepID=UPI0039E89DCC